MKKVSKGGSWSSLPGRYPLWFLFLFFTASNSLLSYAGLPITWKLWIGLFGVAAPFLLAAVSAPADERLAPVPGKELSLPLSPWLWAVALAFILAARLFEPLTFINWPLYDETINGYYVLGLDQKWSWRPFFFFSQLPPLFIWLLFLLWKACGSLLAAIRLQPIILSFLILSAAYAACRPFFTRSFSLLYTVMVGLSFWALFYGRISHQGILLVLWEYMAVACLGKCLKAGGADRPKWLTALGILVGAGFYTYFSWPLVAVWVLAVVMFGLLGSPPKRTMAWGWLILPVGALLSPLLLAYLQHGYGGYFRMLWSFKGGNDWSLQLSNTLFCLASFGWGHASKAFYYGPVWGGILNPPSCAAALLGVLFLLQRRGQPAALSLLVGFPLFLLPAFLTNTLTDMREVQVLPLMSLVAALGVRSLLETLPPRKGSWFLVLFLGVSTALDLTHLIMERDYLNGYWEGQKTSESAKAFRILDQLQRQKGPGLVLTSFSNDVYTYDQSLSVSTYPFNAALNPRLSPEEASWLAVVANVHFQPFLERRFPGAQMTRLSEPGDPGKDNFNGGLMLAVLPLTPQNRPGLMSWVGTDGLFRKMSAQVMDLPIGEARRRILKTLMDALPALPKDPFIRSCYWEMVYFNYNWENLYGDRNKGVNFPAAVGALREALKEGYPTAYFYNELGSCYVIAGDYGKARTAFEAAVHAPLNLTPAADNLKALDRLGMSPSSH